MVNHGALTTTSPVDLLSGPASYDDDEEDAVESYLTDMFDTVAEVQSGARVAVAGGGTRYS